MRKLTGSLNSGADVHCLGNGPLLEGVGWFKWGGVIPFCAPRNGGCIKFCNYFWEVIYFFVHSNFLPTKKETTLKESTSPILFIYMVVEQTFETVNLCPFRKDIRAATLTSFIGISPSDSSWRLNQILFISSSLSLLCLSLICFFERFLDLNFRMCSGNILTFFLCIL